MSKKEINIKLVEKAVSLIEGAMGSQTANLYRNFYADKTTDVVLESVRELLVESLGEDYARKKMKHLKSK
jgi:hypothetical protein